MKRYIPSILLCLLLGVVTTVGVAWGCVLSHPYPPVPHGMSWTRPPLTVYEESFMKSEYERLSQNSNRCDHIWCGSRSFGFISAWAESEINVVFDKQQSLMCDMSGWPFLALIDRSGRMGQLHITSARLQLPEFITKGREYRYLQVIPILPGFLFNTLFYGVIWFGLFFGIGATRRAIRRKRGRCPKCGYDLRGDFNSGCSECGWGREA